MIEKKINEEIKKENIQDLLSVELVETESYSGSDWCASSSVDPGLADKE